MDKEHLDKFYENNTKIILTLKGGRFYTGYILNFGESSFMFKDKYDNEIPISYDAVEFVDVAVGGSNE